MKQSTIKTALVSVSDKTGVVDFCLQLHQQGIQVLSTGGTARLLAESDIPVTEVSDYTKFPEMMDGRVKTLHPKVHGGILGRRGIDDQVMADHDIRGIDLVVVNLYPFQQTVAQPDCDLATAIENIDIGGPAMIRSAAKNHASVGVVVDPADYASIVEELKNQGQRLAAETRFKLALKSFQHTARYDTAISAYLAGVDATEDSFPTSLNLHFDQQQIMRYGENPHQAAAFYAEANPAAGSITAAKQLQGKALSYNNIADTDAALECVKQFEQPACVIVKHANPCGVAVAESVGAAYERAFATDPESAFGGIIAFNRPLDADTAKAIVDKQFVEVIIAPSVSEAAVEVVASKKNVRLLECGQWPDQPLTPWDYKRVNGGLLVQQADAGLYKDLQVVTQRQPSEQEMDDLLFSWRVAKFVKSNAIVYGKDGMTIGVGAGQMSRINSARIAGIKAEHAGLVVPGSVMASDAFFPFRDGLDSAAEAGIRAVIQPGGSMRDEEVITAANEHDMAMVFTGMRHFRH